MRTAAGSERLAALALVLLGGCGEPDPSRAAPASAEQAPAVAAAEEIDPAPERTALAPTAALPEETKAMTSLPPLVRGQSRIPAALQGEWRVVAQSVAGDGVQAYGDNDPALVGARLSITEGGASWAGTEGPLTGACEEAYFDGETSGAALGGVRDEHAAPLRRVGANVEGVRDLRFLCMGEGSDWGPAAEELRMLLLADGRLVVPYSDNLLLVLEKA